MVLLDQYYLHKMVYVMIVQNIYNAEEASGIKNVIDNDVGYTYNAQEALGIKNLSRFAS